MTAVARASAVARALGVRARGLLRVLSTEGFPGEPLGAAQGSPGGSKRALAKACSRRAYFARRTSARRASETKKRRRQKPAV